MRNVSGVKSVERERVYEPDTYPRPHFHRCRQNLGRQRRAGRHRHAGSGHRHRHARYRASTSTHPSFANDAACGHGQGWRAEQADQSLWIVPALTRVVFATAPPQRTPMDMAVIPPALRAATLWMPRRHSPPPTIPRLSPNLWRCTLRQYSSLQSLPSPVPWRRHPGRYEQRAAARRCEGDELLHLRR